MTCHHFYLTDLNLLHWGANGHLAVALGDSIYIWNSQTAEIMQLCQMDVPESYVASVKWVKEGSYLAVGTSEGIVQVSIQFKMCSCFLENN